MKTATKPKNFQLFQTKKLRLIFKYVDTQLTYDTSVQKKKKKHIFVKLSAKKSEKKKKTRKRF